MSNIEERDASDLGQFGALTVEQQAMVNAFAEMVRRGQVPVPSGEPSHIKGDLPLEEGDKRDSTQVDDSRERLGDEMETESLRVELQHAHGISYKNAMPSSGIQLFLVPLTV